MATKFERAINAADKRAQEYIDSNRLYWSKQYYMSNDQITRIGEAFRKAFIEGAMFK